MPIVMITNITDAYFYNIQGRPKQSGPVFWPTWYNIIFSLKQYD